MLPAPGTVREKYCAHAGDILDASEADADLGTAPVMGVGAGRVASVEDRTRQVDQALLVHELEDPLISRQHAPARDEITKRRCTVGFDAPQHGGRPAKHSH